MTIGAAAWEVRATGNDTNGGSYVSGGTDYSQTDSKRASPTFSTDISTTDAVANGTTTLTSAGANFGTGIVGNIIYLAGGSGSLAAVRRQVISRTNATTIVLDAAVASGTDITMNIGGALASLGTAVGSATALNIIWMQTGAYTISSTSPNVAGGIVSTAISVLRIEGYATVRGDLGTAPVLTASGISTATIITSTGVSSPVRNLTVDGAGLTAIKGFSLGRGLHYKLWGKNCTNNGVAGASNIAQFSRCLCTGCSTQPAFAIDHAHECAAIGNSVAGFSTSQPNAYFVDCISAGNSGASSDGFLTTGNMTFYERCVAYNNGRDGLRVSGDSAWLVNNICEANSGIGLNIGSNSADSNAVYGNGTNTNAVGTLALNTITLTSSAFVDAANSNFALNAVAGGGALLRGAGQPGITPGGYSTGYLDIGAVQAKALSTLGVGFEGGMVA